VSQALRNLFRFLNAKGTTGTWAEKFASSARSRFVVWGVARAAPASRFRARGQARKFLSFLILFSFSFSLANSQPFPFPWFRRGGCPSLSFPRRSESLKPRADSPVCTTPLHVSPPLYTKGPPFNFFLTSSNDDRFSSILSRSNLGETNLSSGVFYSTCCSAAVFFPFHPCPVGPQGRAPLGPRFSCVCNSPLLPPVACRRGTRCGVWV